MNTHAKRFALVSAACMLVACSKGASTAANESASANSASASGGSTSGWIANGATACDRYLTPDVVGAIFKNPAGRSKKLSGQACSFDTADSSSISITLIQGGPAALDAHMKYLTDPVAFAGVGDKAIRDATGIEAVKGTDRMCDIDVMPPFGNKLSGEALAQKVGEICNKLFALP